MVSPQTPVTNLEKPGAEMSSSQIYTSDSPTSDRGRHLGRKIAIGALSLLLAVLGFQFAQGSGGAQAAESVGQCNGVDNTGGLGIVCEVTVVNNLNMETGVESSTVTVTECHGLANTTPSSCTGPTTTSYDTLTTTITQCNDSENGGGSSIICSVHVVNNITGGDAPTGATVNQCNGSGEGGGTEPTLDCNPYPATTSGATITQCNGSVNGGGGTARVHCSVVAGSTESAQLVMIINQCNASDNGGGSVATCSVDLTTYALPVTPESPEVPGSPPVQRPPVVSG